MSESKQCPRCKRRIPSIANACRCGWSNADTAENQHVRIACWCPGCQESAICRVWASSGWANVCLTHYPTMPHVSRPSNSPFVRERVPGEDDV